MANYVCMYVKVITEKLELIWFLLLQKFCLTGVSQYIKLNSGVCDCRRNYMCVDEMCSACLSVLCFLRIF